MFRHSPEAPIVDLPIVEVIDLEVVVVIRFVAMESIPESRVAQGQWGGKGEMRMNGEWFARVSGEVTGTRWVCMGARGSAGEAQGNVNPL